MFPVYTGDVEVRVRKATLRGWLRIPKDAIGGVLFAHGSGSSRSSPRNQTIAEALNKSGFATLLFDLLTADEERVDKVTGEFRFNIPFLTKRLVGATDWFSERTVHSLPMGYFGASTGAAAALMAATERPDTIQAVVSRGGRPDLVGEDVLACVKTNTLFIVGSDDPQALKCNRQSLDLIPSDHKELIIVPRATHLFEEPGTLEQVAEHASRWFGTYLGYVAMFRD